MKALFGPFSPDLPDHLSDTLSGISNAYPGANGYRPVGAFVGIASALPTACKGAASFVSPVGTSTVIAGTATTLYRQWEAGWQEIGTGYSIQGDGRWRFAQFGGLAIATDQADAMVKIDLQSGSVSLLAGSPPKVQTLGVVQNFLVGGIVDGNTAEVVWSGENNAEYWTAGSRKSDYNIFPDGGAITGIISGEYGLILQRGAVRRMTYVGGNVLFRMDKIASNVGCATVHSVTQFGELAFWYGDDGFKMWDGSQIIPIGFETVDATFAEQYTVRDWPSMSAAIDGVKGVVAWSMGDKIWLFNWRLKRWSIIDLAAQILFSGFVKSLGIDEQDPDVGAADDDLDGVGLDSFDDPRFAGGDPRFYVVNGSNVLGTLSGSNLAASFTARNVEMVEGRDTVIRNARPMSDVTAGATLSIKGRQRLGDAGTTVTASTLTATGVMPIRVRGRFIKSTFSIAAGNTWGYAQGLDYKAAVSGAR